MLFNNAHKFQYRKKAQAVKRLRLLTSVVFGIDFTICMLCVQIITGLIVCTTNNYPAYFCNTCFCIQ